METRIEATFEKEKFRAKTTLAGGMDYEYLEWWDPEAGRWRPVQSRMLRDCFWDHYLGAFGSICKEMAQHEHLTQKEAS